jgi:hypothetical protein
VNATRTAGVCLVLAGVALAGPQFRIGTKLAWHGAESYSESFDTTGAPISRVVYERFSVGPAVEASYGPVWGVFTGRADLAQMSVFTTSPGGAGLSLFPMLGLDLMAEPGTRWRVKPYLWAGVRTAGYTLSSSAVESHPTATTELREGLGLKFRLNSRTDLFAETQMYQRYNDWEGILSPGDGSFLAGETTLEGVGLVNAELGVRYALGK